MGMVVQIIGSLVAILLLVWVAHRLGLGGDAHIRSEEQARELARDLLDDFDPVAVAVDSGGRAALLRTADGRIALLRMHGTHPVARLLGPSASAIVCNADRRSALEVNIGERRFGPASLAIAAPHDWKAAIDAIAKAQHA